MIAPMANPTTTPQTKSVASFDKKCSGVYCSTPMTMATTTSAVTVRGPMASIILSVRSDPTAPAGDGNRRDHRADADDQQHVAEKVWIDDERDAADEEVRLMHAPCVADVDAADGAEKDPEKERHG